MHRDVRNKKIRNWKRDRQVSIRPVSNESSLLNLDYLGYSTWEKDFWVHHYQTSYLDVEIVEQGSLLVTVNGKKYIAEANDAILIPPGESRLCSGPAGFCRKRYILISGSIYRSNMKTLGLDKTILLKNFLTADFREKYDSIFERLEDQENKDYNDLFAWVYKLLLIFSQKASRSVYPEKLILAKNYIERYFSTIQSLEEICAHIGCGKTTLQALFRHHLKSTPTQYLTEIRMKYARHCIDDSCMMIKTISDYCGYANPLYFSNVFKAYFGVSPRECRKNASSKIDQEK